MSEHIVKSYDEELMELGRKIAEMGGLSETMLANAIQALVRGDTDLAQRVIETDHRQWQSICGLLCHPSGLQPT